MTRSTRIRALLIVLGILFLYPFETTMLPAKKVLVVTDDWRPVQGIRVRQIWQNYTFESQGHEEELTTDVRGRVIFPPRTMRSSIISRLVRPIWIPIRQGVHGSSGVHTDMFPLGDATGKPVGDQPVTAEEGEIVFRL